MVEPEIIVEPIRILGRERRKSGNYRGLEFKPSLEDRMIVWQMIACGESQEAVAKFFEISHDTFTKHFRYEIDNAKTATNGAVGSKCLQSALDGNVSNMQFWLSRRAGWTETKELNLTETKVLKVDLDKRAVLLLAQAIESETGDDEIIDA